MVPFKLTEEQVQKLGSLANAIAPHFLVQCGYYHCSFASGHKDIPIWYVVDSKDEKHWSWLEFCMRYMVDYAAHVYINHHIDTTFSWAKHMISQKVAHEIETINPIDTLYDIYINPNNYKQSL